MRNTSKTSVLMIDHRKMFRRNRRIAVLAAFILSLVGGIGGGKFAAAAPAPAPQTIITSPPAATIATTYSTKKREFRVGILLLDSTIETGAPARGPENPDPYVFYIADSLTELKPQGWEFVNPIAPATITNAIKVRWDARMGGNSNYSVGQKVSKDMAAYWEVGLTQTSLNDLLQFDLLFITNHRTTAFTPADREKMRKLVDAGGIVWIEDCGNMRIGTDSGGGVYKNDRFFLDQLQFTGGSGNPFPSGKPAEPVVYQPTHPILNTPYQLSYDDVANLGDKNYADFAMLRIDPTTNKPTLGMPNPETLVNIVGNHAVGAGNGPYQPYIAAGYFGSGAVIMTSGDSGCDINDYAGGTNSGSGGNSGPFCGPNIRTAHPMDLKFLYNCVAWGGANSAYRRNDRRTASTFEAVGAPLLGAFDFTGPLYASDDIVNGQSAPLFVNNLLFTTGVTASGKMTLRAYDPKPSRDYDGDGNPDDGRIDAALGYGYDEVWEAVTGGAAGLGAGGVAGPTIGGAATFEQPSSPVYGEVDTGAATAQTALLFVALPDGTVNAYKAFPNSATTGQIQSTSSAIWTMGPTKGGGLSYDYVSTHGVAPSPVFYENKVFEVQPNGMVRCLSAVDGSLLWQSFDDTAPPDGSVIVPTGTPTIGLSRLTTDTNQSSTPNAGVPSRTTALAAASLGATNDVMLYFPAVTTKNGAVAGQVYAYWLGTRNEVQKTFSNDQYGNAGLMNTRISGGVGSPGANVYGMSVGTDTTTNAAYTFLQPRIRVFSPERYPASDPSGNAEGVIKVTAQEHYALGIESTDYSGAADTTTATTAGQLSGRVQVTKLGSANAQARPPGPKPWTNSDATGNESDILIAVDYDVTYITSSSNGVITPPNYSQNNTQIGARFNPNLRIPSYDALYSGGTTPDPFKPATLDTLAFSPLDTLIFGARQAQPTSGSTGGVAGGTTAPETLVSVFGLHEEEGNTRLRWRFSLTHPLSDGVTNQGAGQVNDVIVTDNYPLNNNINFDENWPLVDVANKPGSVNFSASNTAANSSPVTITRTIGSPIVSNDGTTYVLAEGVVPQRFATSGLSPAYVTVLMALKSEPSVTLTLPQPFDESAGVTVSQLDALSVTSSGTPRVITTSANNDGNNIIHIDGPHGKIDVVNFAVGPDQQFSASQSFVVSVTPRGEATPRRFIVSPTPDSVLSGANASVQLGANTTVTQPVLIGGGYTPLLWYYVLLGQPQSAPTLIGDYVFFTLKNLTGPSTGTTALNKTFLMGIEADPAANDPAVRIGFSEQVANVYAKQVNISGVPDNQTTDHVKAGQPISTALGAATGLYTSPPVAAGGVLALNGSAGTFGFTDQTTLIADARRVIEVGADSSAQWELAGTQQRSVVGGPLPIFDRTGGLSNPGPPAPTGRTSLDTRPISHPTTVRRIINGDYLIPDTGNNRVVRTDRGGVITWTLDTMTDPYQLLGGGEPTTLNSPTDVQFYVTPTLTTNATGATSRTGYEVHYLVADSGNSRVVEVADYFDANGQPVDAPGTAANSTKGRHVVVWATRTQSQQGRQYRFTSISRYLGTDPSGRYYGYPYIIATVSNARIAGGSSSATGDFSGGSLVSLQYAPYNTALQVSDANGNPTTLRPWPAGANAVAIASSEPAGNGTVLAAADDLQIRDASGNLVVRRLARPTYFQQLTFPPKDMTNPVSATNPTRIVYLVCDTDGVYAVYATADATGKPVRQVVWMFRQQEYDALNGYDDINQTVLTGGRISQPATAAGDPNELPRFIPSSVRLLTNGHLLLTNSWTGKSALFQSGRFVGEVLEVNPEMDLLAQLNKIDANTGTTPTLYYPGGILYNPNGSRTSVYSSLFAGFSAPRLFLGTFTGTTPVLNDQFMGTPGNTNLLEQPLFSDRQ